MMRFNWPIDKKPVKERYKVVGKINTPERLRKLSLLASFWPTVDELESVIAPMTADTVLQILRGDGIYRGWDCQEQYDHDKKSLNRRVTHYEYERTYKNGVIVDLRSQERLRRQQDLEQVKRLEEIKRQSYRRLRGLDNRLERIGRRLKKKDAIKKQYEYNRKINQKRREQQELENRMANVLAFRRRWRAIYRNQPPIFKKAIQAIAVSRNLTTEQATELFIEALETNRTGA